MPSTLPPENAPAVTAASRRHTKAERARVVEQFDLFSDQVDAPPAAPSNAVGLSDIGFTSASAPTADWQHAPVEAFVAWKRSQLVFRRELASHSIEQYEAMFGAFVRWAAAEATSVLHASTGDVERFLDSRQGRGGLPAAATTRRRYLQLLASVFEHLVNLDLRKSNPAEDLMSNMSHMNFNKPPPRILSGEVVSAYIDWSNSRPTEGWHSARDRALRLVFLASGITVGEMQRLTPQDVIPTPHGFELVVVSHGFTPAHRVPVANFASQALKDWLQALFEWPDTASLFPARVFGFGVDKPDACEAIATPECFRVIQEALQSIGYTETRQGPQTLRNTFIATQIRNGVKDSRIMSWCGLGTTDTLVRIGAMVPIREGEPLPA